MFRVSYRPWQYILRFLLNLNGDYEDHLRLVNSSKIEAALSQLREMKSHPYWDFYGL